MARGLDLPDGEGDEAPGGDGDSPGGVLGSSKVELTVASTQEYWNIRT